MTNTIESISYIQLNDGLDPHPIDAVSIEGKLISDFQEAGKIVQTISISSTDEEIPSAKCIYELVYGSYTPPMHDYSKDYLTIEANEDGLTASLSVNACEYCVDGDGNWKTLSAGTSTESINSGHTLSFRGNLTPNSSKGIGTFTINKKCNLKGNCMSMLFGDNAADNYSLSGKNYAFYKLFYNCSNIVNVSSNFLPATTLTDYCYQYMFYGCTSLTSAPALPATTLYGSCYTGMFAGCTSLTSAPALPATTLEDDCYGGMFSNCTSLTTAPVLPAKTLTTDCYNNMFKGCTSLNYIKCLATDISAYNCTYNWVDGVAATGTFVKAAGMTGWTTSSSGIPNGWAVEEYIDYTKEPLTFKITSGGSINWTASDSSLTKTIEYKLNDSHNWASITSNTGESAPTIEVNPGDKIQFRGDNTAYCGDNPELYSIFGGSTAEFEIEGNIMSLINSTDFSTLTTLESNFTFAFLFSNCTGLTSAENLILPATPLTMGCYVMMFQGCTSLTTAPKLPATTLAMGCYDSMFQDCTSLTTVPKLPATTLAEGCYEYMFNGCTSLTTAPELPATTLADYCYFDMFDGCSSLTTAPELPATTLAEGCYNSMFSGCKSLTIAPVLPATTLATSCYSEMFWNCTSLTTAPELPATTLAMGCYSMMFNGCTSLTTAPKLPATTLANNCYSDMFWNCTSLTTAPSALPATTLARNCYSSMFNGCTSLTTAPTLPSTILANYCYSNMFEGCTSLTTAPELPATTLVNNCYDSMFYKCTKLNYIKCLATDISASNCTNNWVSGVASRGTFVKAPSMTSWTTGVRGIPKGWTVEEYIDYTKEPLTFNILSAGTINWTASNTDIAKTIDYKLNDGNWASVTSNTGSSAPTITVNSGDKLQLRGNNAQYATGFPVYNSFGGSTASFEVEGNIMSLIYGDDFKNKLTISSAYAFTGLFRECANLVSAENLILPATTLANGCYLSMFRDCTKLTTVPELPATTLAQNCYSTMFKGCTSLTTVPSNLLPATTLANNCYSAMFMRCTSLTTAPELPATTLASTCYQNMFKGCTSLKTAPALPATNLADSCYSNMFYECKSLNYIKCLATDILVTDCISYWVYGVASTGTFVKAASMTGWRTDISGIPTGWTVQDA